MEKEIEEFYNILCERINTRHKGKFTAKMERGKRACENVRDTYDSLVIRYTNGCYKGMIEVRTNHYGYPYAIDASFPMCGTQTIGRETKEEFISLLNKIRIGGEDD